jgi:uncharacterized protein YjbI with pentapeptide repeats
MARWPISAAGEEYAAASATRRYLPNAVADRRCHCRPGAADKVLAAAQYGRPAGLAAPRHLERHSGHCHKRASVPADARPHNLSAHHDIRYKEGLSTQPRETAMREQKGDAEWETFEKDVEALFRVADYETERNVEIGGFEFDVIATRDEFAGMRVRVAVECKLRSNAVSNTDIHSFIAAFTALRDRASLTHGVVVTNDRFSRQAHEAINQHPQIKLMTFSNLEDELLGARSYLNGAAKNYHSQIGGIFVDPSADLQDNLQKTIVPKLAEYLTARVAGNDELFALVLGDFGSGKTTVAEQIHRNCSASYKTGAGRVYPFIFYLRTLAQYDDERSFITAQTQIYRSVSTELFSRIQSKGKTLLILDGFDEVATQATVQERMMFFSRIMRISQNCSHLIITSRPSYFTNLEEVNELIKNIVSWNSSSPLRLSKRTRRDDKARDSAIYKTSEAFSRRRSNDKYRLFSTEASAVFYLRPFTRENIIEFLTPFAEQIRVKHKRSVTEIYDILSTVYDLTDLITRPLLIDMFVDVLLYGKLSLNDPDLEIGPTSLYQIYVNRHLDRDWSIRQFLKREERLTFARAAAIAMLEKGGSLEASYSSVESVVSRGMEGVDTWRQTELNGQMDRVVNDVRVCAFINVTNSNRIEFAHKSFMEYFVADVVVAKLRSNKPITELARKLNYETLFFVGSFCLVRAEYRIDIVNHLTHIGYFEDAEYQSKLKLAIIYSERDSIDRTYSDISFESLKIRNRVFNSCQFSRIAFRKLVLEDLRFLDCSFAEVAFSGSLDRVQMQGCRGAIELVGPVRELSIQGADLHFAGSSGELNFQGGHWSGSSIKVSATTCRLTSINLFGVDIALMDVSTLNLADVRMTDCMIRGSNRHTVIKIDKGCRLNRICLHGIAVSTTVYRELEHVLGGCYGYVLVDDEHKELSAFSRASRKGKSRIYVGWNIVGDVIFVASHLSILGDELSGKLARRPDIRLDDWRDEVLKRWIDRKGAQG